MTIPPVPPGHEPPPTPSPPPLPPSGPPAAHGPGEHGEQGAASRWAPPPVSGPSAEPAWGTAPPPPTRHVAPPPPPPPNPRRGKWLILGVLVAAVVIAAVVLLTQGDDGDSGGSGSAAPTASDDLVEPNLENVRAALPALDEVPDGWIVTTVPSTLTLYTVISGMMVCGVDTSGATAPSAEATVAFAPASGTEPGVSVAAVAMAGATESRRLLDIGRAAAQCVAKAGGAAGGLTVGVEPSVDVEGADTESLVLRVDGVVIPGGTATVYGVATTVGQFGVAATAPTVEQARALAESTLAGLRR